MRQIDADKLEREITLAYIETCRGLTLEQIDAVARFSAKVISIIGHTSTADTEAVVRCKDCKYWNGETHGCNRNPCVEPWWETDSCNYGERKDETDTETLEAWNLDGSPVRIIKGQKDEVEE